MARSPIIVLVRPQLGENIGKAARAMLNFGLVDMRIVAPRDGWPNPDAGPSAAGADIVLEQARIFDSTAEAVADCAHVYATTVRKRGVTKLVVTPEQATVEMARQSGRSAILFGPERSGLNSDDVGLARTIVTAPINPDFGSLNLAQAVLLLAYEWSRVSNDGLVQPTSENQLTEPAKQSELESLIDHLEQELEGTRFFYPPERTAATKRTLRNLLTQPRWTGEQVQAMRGVVAALTKSR